MAVLLTPERPRKALRGGWFHTGDAASGIRMLRRNRDRMKDVIIIGGETFSSVEVEGVLLATPAVQNAIAGSHMKKMGRSTMAFLFSMKARARRNASCASCPGEARAL